MFAALFEHCRGAAQNIRAIFRGRRRPVVRKGGGGCAGRLHVILRCGLDGADGIAGEGGINHRFALAGLQHAVDDRLRYDRLQVAAHGGRQARGGWRVGFVPALRGQALAVQEVARRRDMRVRIGLKRGDLLKRVRNDIVDGKIGVDELVHERGVGAVLEEAAHEIGQQLLVAADRRVDARARAGRKKVVMQRLAYLAGLFELVAGLFILVGFQTKITAYLLAAFCVFTGLVFHSGPINVPDFPEGANGLLTMFNGLMMMKNITIAGGFLVLAAFGPGALSVDARLGSGKVVAA